MSYNNPIVTEMYSEFFFTQQINAQQQYDIVEAIKSNYESVEVTPDIVASPNPIGTRYRLWKNNRRELFQVFANRIAFNYIPKEETVYAGWSYYFSKCIESIGFVDIKNKDISFNKISLCYIDKIENINDNDFILGKYINCDGKIIPQYFELTKIATDVILGSGNINKEDNTQIKLNVITPTPNNYTISLNTLITSFIKEDESIDSKLDILHDNMIKIFELVITNYVRKVIMKGKV